MLTQRAFQNQSPNTIPFRVVRHDDDSPSDPDGPSPDWTLRRFYEEFFSPSYLVPKNRTAETVKLYGQVVDLWESFFSKNPTLGELDGNQALCLEFVAKLKKRPGLRTRRMADNTVRKLCTHLQKMLDFAGPRNRWNRSAACVMLDVPYLERPEAVKEDPSDDFTIDEIGLWLGACRFAPPTRNIRRCPPEVFCRKHILFVYNTGLRIGTVMQLTDSMLGRKRENWIDIPASVYKGRKKGLHLYLNEPAREAIEAVHVPGDPRLFPWANWPISKTWLNIYMRRILARSGIPEERYFGNLFHGLRKSLITWLNSENPMVAKIVGGHGSNDVQKDYYVNPKIMVELLDRVPQPVAAEPERQGRLF